MGGVLASLNALWVNDPMKVAVAEYKPLQLRVASNAGLQTPRTLVTNDHVALTAFELEVGDLVCKQLSALALYDHGELTLTYTSRVAAADVDPAALAVTVAQFQEWVPKAYEARVIMVGRRPLTAAIFAASDESRVDWRRDYSALTYVPIDPPAAVTQAMRRYLDVFNLAYAAFDFAITSSGDWIFLEANPMGQWLWLNEDAGLRIAEAFADLLTVGLAL